MFIAVAIVQGCLGVLQLAPQLDAMFQIKGNNIGTFDNHAGYAICIVTGITFLLYFQRYSQRYIRYISLLATILLVIALLVSNSRNGIITATIIIGIYYLYSKKHMCTNP